MARGLPRRIQTPKDVARFFLHLAKKEQINFHPDDDFEDYGSDVRGKWVPAYTFNEAALRNDLMYEAWRVSIEYGFDIYCMGMWALYIADPIGDAPQDCDKERDYFLPRKPGVLDWKPVD